MDVYQILGLIAFFVIIHYGYKWGKRKSKDKYK